MAHHHVGQGIFALEHLVEQPFLAVQSLMVIGVVLALFWRSRPGGVAKQDASVNQEASAASLVIKNDSWDINEFFSRQGAPEDPHEEGTMIPSMGLNFGNAAPAPFDNEFAMGRFLSLHRATHNKELDKTGNYPYGKYFCGKKRLWEARIQFTLKRPIEQQELFFGVELENSDSAPMSAATKKAQSTIVGLLKQVLGDKIYHSSGDGPLENPIFSVPMWAADQFLVTPEGEEPPELSNLAVSSMGCKRSEGVKEFQKEMAQVKFEVGPTYTFCLWGISRFLDKLNWQIRVPFMRPIDFDQFAGNPPVHAVIYFLSKGESAESETRHVNSRKNYLFNVAFWSSKRRPNTDRLESLFGDCKAALAAARAPPPLRDLNRLRNRTRRDSRGLQHGRTPNGSSSKWGFACCGSR